MQHIRAEARPCSKLPRGGIRQLRKMEMRVEGCTIDLMPAGLTKEIVRMQLCATHGNAVAFLWFPPTTTPGFVILFFINTLPVVKTVNRVCAHYIFESYETSTHTFNTLELHLL